MSYDRGMLDLRTATRAELIQLIVELSARNTELEKRIVALEGRPPKPKADLPQGTASPPAWVKANRPKGKKKARAKRKLGSGRKRSKATRQVTHAIDRCTRCGCRLGGGFVKRTREVLHIPLRPAEVVEHIFIERRCPVCNKRQTPGAEVLRHEVLGQHRVSQQTMAIVATLREELRLPINLIQGLLQTLYGLELSQGELVAILQAVAAKGRDQVAELREQLKVSPVVHADETTWRENGQNGYFWSFSTPQINYLEYRHSRSGQIVEDVLGQAQHTILTCDFYAAYNRHPGPIQRCWAHLLRAIHDLKESYPDHEQVQVWGKAVYALYREALAFRDRHRHRTALECYDATMRFRRELLALCEPFLEKDVPQRVLCQRCQRFINQLFRFVLNPQVPPDNNAAERAVRSLAVSRKISGGTRSPRGSETKAILASLFGTWRLQGLNPFIACAKLLASP